MSEEPRTDTTDEESSVLASDAERDQVVARLNEAVTEGRLTLTEFSDRSAAVYTTRTRAALRDFVKDLPKPAGPLASQLEPVTSGFARPTAAASERLIIGTIKRDGQWRLPAGCQMSVTLGTIKLDLREAAFTSREVTIEATTVVGSIKVVVPDRIRFTVDGDTAVGGRSVQDNHIPDSIPAMTVHLRLNTGLGTVKVYVVGEERKRKKHFW